MIWINRIVFEDWSHTSPEKLYLWLLYNSVTLLQKEENSGMTKSFRKIFSKSGNFTSTTSQDWEKSENGIPWLLDQLVCINLVYQLNLPRVSDSKLSFGWTLKLFNFSMTGFNRISVNGLIPVTSISLWVKIKLM